MIKLYLYNNVGANQDKSCWAQSSLNIYHILTALFLILFNSSMTTLICSSLDKAK